MSFVIRRKSFVLPLVLLFGTLSAFSQSYISRPVKLGDIKVSKDGKSEVEKWREDLVFIKTELPKKHKNLFHRLNRESFFSAIKELDAKIPMLTKNQVVLEFSRIVGMARDGHTSLSPLFDPKMKFQFFPIGMYKFEEGIYIRRASPEYKNIVGGKVLRIGKSTIDEAYRKLIPYTFGDNGMSSKEYAPIFLASPEILQALEISDNSGIVPLVTEKDGKITTTELKLTPGKDHSIHAILASMKTWIDARSSSNNPTPLVLKKPGETFWFEYVAEKKLLYVQLNSVLNGKNKTLAKFFEEVFEFAKKKELDKFVLDLRFNGGGNNTLIKPIIRGLIRLENIDRPGHLFVITGRRTFSAAQNLVNELETWTNPIFVGEPTASHVNLYGDARSFYLPNSGLRIRISELWWQNKNPRDQRKWTAPHVAAEPTFATYKNNLDPAMNAIYAYNPKKTLREIALEAYQAGDIKSFREKVIAFKKDPVNKYQELERQINGFGYQLIRQKDYDTAIVLFNLNVELYPKSANVYDSLAEAHMLKGNKETAVKLYKRSLELNPQNSNAVRQIKKIQNHGKQE